MGAVLRCKFKSLRWPYLLIVQQGAVKDEHGSSTEPSTENIQKENSNKLPVNTEEVSRVVPYPAQLERKLGGFRSKKVLIT